MSNTYTVKTGDTFSSVSRVTTGSEKNASKIKRANPHASAPLQAGTILQIPAVTDAQVFNPNGLDLKIDGPTVVGYHRAHEIDVGIA